MLYGTKIGPFYGCEIPTVFLLSGLILVLSEVIDVSVIHVYGEILFSRSVECASFACSCLNRREGSSRSQMIGVVEISPRPCVEH